MSLSAFNRQINSYGIFCSAVGLPNFVVLDFYAIHLVDGPYFEPYMT